MPNLMEIDTTIGMVHFILFTFKYYYCAIFYFFFSCCVFAFNLVVLSIYF